MMNVNEVFSQVSVVFFEIESATLTDGTMMSDTGFPGFRVSLVGINGYDLSDTFCVLLRDRELFRIVMLTNVGIPDAAFFPEIALFKPMLKTFNCRYVRVIGVGRVNHVEGAKFIPLISHISEVFNSLPVAREPLILALNSHSS